MSKTVKL